MKIIRNWSLHIEETKFEKNKANYFSNVLSSNGNYLAIKKCLFFSNTPTGVYFSLVMTQGRSGVIEVRAGTLIIDMSYFYNNSKNTGGVLGVFFPMDSTILGRVLISKCWFFNNSAFFVGVANIQANSKCQIIFKNSVFLWNWAQTGKKRFFIIL